MGTEEFKRKAFYFGAVFALFLLWVVFAFVAKAFHVSPDVVVNALPMVLTAMIAALLLGLYTQAAQKRAQASVYTEKATGKRRRKSSAHGFSKN